jgi:hypothetical protein
LEGLGTIGGEGAVAVKTSLTHFLRFLSTRGLARVQIVTDSQQKYDPATDYYRKLREGIIDALASGNTKPLWALLGSVSDDRKIPHYKVCIERLEGWLRKNKLNVISQLDPATYKLGHLRVNVSPELVMQINARRHIVKLYMAKEPLSPYALRAYGFLVRNTHGESAEPAILDVRNGKLRTARVTSKRRTLQWLLGEAAAFIEIWEGRAA